MSTKTQSHHDATSPMFAWLLPPIGGALIALLVLTAVNTAIYFVTGYDVFFSLVRGGAVPSRTGDIGGGTFISADFGRAALLFLFVVLGVLAAIASSYVDRIIRRRHGS